MVLSGLLGAESDDQFISWLSLHHDDESQHSGLNTNFNLVNNENMIRKSCIIPGRKRIKRNVKEPSDRLEIQTEI